MHSQTQALTAAAVPPGKLGVWWFLASEITVFGGLIGAYIVVRLGSSGWDDHSAQLNFALAVVNTFVLLTSSFTMVLAFAAAEEKNPGRLRAWLLITILLGVAFLTIKGFEYAGEMRHGFAPQSGIFWSFYYGMTGLHALHVLGGIGANLILLLATLKGKLSPHEHRIELAGLYWHFVDVVWIFLFPLLYLS